MGEWNRRGHTSSIIQQKGEREKVLHLFTHSSSTYWKSRVCQTKQSTKLTFCPHGTYILFGEEGNGQ